LHEKIGRIIIRLFYTACFDEKNYRKISIKYSLIDHSPKLQEKNNRYPRQDIQEIPIQNKKIVREYGQGKDPLAHSIRDI